MKLPALSNQTEGGMPYLLVNLTKARMKSDADVPLTISKWTAIVERHVNKRIQTVTRLL